MPDLTVAQLLAQPGRCSPRCLTAAGSEMTPCAFPCGGRWHGILARTTVPGTATIATVHAGPMCEGQTDLLDVVADLDAA